MLVGTDVIMLFPHGNEWPYWSVLEMKYLSFAHTWNIEVRPV